MLVHRLAALCQARFEGAHQPLGQRLALALGEGVDHGARHAVIGEDVADRDAIGAVRLGMDRQGLVAGERGGLAGAVDHRELAERRKRRGADELRQHALGTHPLLQEAEAERPELRVGDVLGHHGAGGDTQAQRLGTQMLDEVIAMPN